MTISFHSNSLLLGSRSPRFGSSGAPKMSLENSDLTIRPTLPRNSSQVTIIHRPREPKRGGSLDLTVAAPSSSHEPSRVSSWPTAAGVLSSAHHMVADYFSASEDDEDTAAKNKLSQQRVDFFERRIQEEVDRKYPHRKNLKSPLLDAASEIAGIHPDDSDSSEEDFRLESGAKVPMERVLPEVAHHRKERHKKARGKELRTKNDADLLQALKKTTANLPSSQR